MTEIGDGRPVGMQMLARVLRQMRTGAGLTQDQLARKISYARTQVSNTEQAREMPSMEFLAACDVFFGTGSMFVDLRGDVMAGGLPDWALELQDAEARAVSIMSYQPSVVPGLLQTPGYAGAMLSAGMFGEPDERELKERVANRLSRQTIFEKKPRPDYWVIMAEAVLQRLVGSKEVLRGQTEHIIDAMERRLVNLQILPCSAGPSPLAAPATVLELNDGTMVLYEERSTFGSTTSHQGTVRECRKRFDALRAQAASLAESARMVRARLEALQP